MKIISVANQKGGVGKTMTTQAFAVALARRGKRVLIIDMDPQGSLTASFGIQEPDRLDVTLTSLLAKSMNDRTIQPDEGIITTDEGVDFIPGNIELSGLENTLVNAMNRERILINYINEQGFNERYDYILIDTMPSLGMLTINALTASDTVLIPVQASFLSLKGMEQLFRTIYRVKRNLNPRIMIEGIVVTMYDNRTNNARDIVSLINETYEGNVYVFQAKIPRSIRAEENPAAGKSIFSYDPNGKVASAYARFTDEFLNKGE